MSNPAIERLQKKCGKRRFFRFNREIESKGKHSISKESLNSYIILKTKIGQVIKSVGRMTWHQEPKKDVTSCDKPGVGANIH